MCFRAIVVESGVALSAMDIIADELLEGVGDGGVVYYFVDECVDIDSVECLREIYCYECCSMGWSFLVESFYYGVND